MSWTFNSVRIYVQGYSPKRSNTIAELKPLQGTSILHHFGYDIEKPSIRGKVVTNADKDALLALAQTSTSYSLVAPEGTIGDYFVKSITFQRDPTTNSVWFDRPALDCDEPVYTVNLELWED